MEYENILNVSYSIGLGKINPKWPITKLKRLQDIDKLRFLKYEQERKEKAKSSQSIYNKASYIRSNCSSTIRHLLSRAVKEYPSDKKSKTVIKKEKPHLFYSASRNRSTCKKLVELSHLNESEEQKYTRHRTPTLREPVRGYINNIRNILLSKIAIKERKEEIERMKSYIKRKEATFNANKKLYEQDVRLIDDYISLVRNKANEKRVEIMKKKKEERSKEDILANLKRTGMELRNTLITNEETHNEYKTYVDFLNSLIAEKKKLVIEKTKEDHNTFFMTEKEIDDKEDEVKEDEVSIGFSSAEGVLELMEKQATYNFELLKSVQEREQVLGGMMKNYNEIIEKKQMELESMRSDIAELTKEESQKLEYLNLFSQQMETNTQVVNPFIEAMNKERIKKKQQIKSLKKTMKEEINNIRIIFKPNNDDKDSIFRHKDIIYTLKFITDTFLKLKMIRDWKFMSSKGTEEENKLLKRELEEKDRMNELAAAEKLQRNKQLEQERQNKLRDNLNIARTRKFGREMMQRRMLKVKVGKIEHKELRQVDETFNDKYFV